MNVFISWSGPKSRAVALALRDWLPSVIQAVKPWMSAEDIEAGARWNAEISKQLESTTFGIICLTKANQSKPWIMFEAGALAKTLQGTFVVPYLIDLEPAEVEAGPLSQFQSKRANKNDTWQLLVTLNRALASPLSEEQLRRIYDKFWVDLEAVLDELPTDVATTQVRRSHDDVLDEILVLTRGIAQRQQAQTEPNLEGPRRLDWPRRLPAGATTSLVDYFRQDPDFEQLMSQAEPRSRRLLLTQYLRNRYPELLRYRDTYETIYDMIMSFYDAKYRDQEPGRSQTSDFQSLKEIIEGDGGSQADASGQGDQHAK